ncbi:hypothetical protein BKA93DRAFT_443788 [Sparassis latifolia]
MSSDSDFTDIDEEEIPLSSLISSRKKGKTADGKDMYKIKGALKVPRTTTYTTQALYDQLHLSDIDLNADYQRVVKYGDDGSERRICVDGKQRLTSIYRFMDGLVNKDAFTNERFMFKETGKMKGKLLPERYRKIFCNKQIVCVEYQDLTEDDEREIFQRVQMGMALTPAEKLQAISSPTASFIRELQDQYVVDELAQTLEWDTARAGDFRGLASAVYNMNKWPALATMASLSQVEKWLRQPAELEERFCDQAHATFHIFVLLARDSQYNKAFRLTGVKKVSPVEFMAVTLLIFVYKNKLTLAQLSEAIATMRREIRASEVDIRMNARVMKQLLAFIKELNPAKLAPDPGQPPAGKLSNLKRKRTSRAQGHDDADYVPSRRPAPQQLTASQAHEPWLPPKPEPSTSRPPSGPRRPSSASYQSATPSGPRRTNNRSGTPSQATAPPSTRPSSDRLSAIKDAKDNFPPAPSPRPPPTGPALRIPSTNFVGPSRPMHSPSLPFSSHSPTLPYPTPPSTLPPPPPSIPPPPPPPARYDGLGDSLMARMMSRPMAPPQNGRDIHQQQGRPASAPGPLPQDRYGTGRGDWRGYK